MLVWGLFLVCQLLVLGGFVRYGRCSRDHVGDIVSGKSRQAALAARVKDIVDENRDLADSVEPRCHIHLGSWKFKPCSKCGSKTTGRLYIKS